MSHSPGFRASRVREAQGSQRKNSEIYVVCGIRMHLSAYFKTFRTQNNDGFPPRKYENGEIGTGKNLKHSLPDTHRSPLGHIACCCAVSRFWRGVPSLAAWHLGEHHFLRTGQVENERQLYLTSLLYLAQGIML